jgi:Domain of unknown function (DUF5667)
MSLIDAPMALLDRILARRSQPVQPDDPIARMVARTTGRLHPEGDYRRRLRGRIVNQYVAMREGMVSPMEPHLEMGRLGRAVLYATFGVACSVSAVGAASTGSLPGDPLYAVKRQIEELRIQIAPPSVRASLVAMELEERLSEVERLASAGRWALVSVASAEAVAAERRLVAEAGTLPAGEAANLEHHLQVLTGLLATAPQSAQVGLLHAIEASSADHGQAAGGVGHGAGGIGKGGQDRQGGQGPTGGQPTDTTVPQPTPEPARSPHPDPSPQASTDPQTPAPHPTRSPGQAQDSKTP